MILVRQKNKIKFLPILTNEIYRLSIDNETMADANSGAAWGLPDFAHWVWSAIKLWPLSRADH